MSLPHKRKKKKRATDLASPIKGIFCGGLNAYCMQSRPLFLRTSGSSGVLKALLLERNGQLSCNPKKKKKKKKKHHAAVQNAPPQDPVLPVEVGSTSQLPKSAPLSQLREVARVPQHIHGVIVGSSV